MTTPEFNLNNPDYFYKYLSEKRTDFFDTCSFRFTQKNSLNDPFEQSLVDRSKTEAFSPEEQHAFVANCANTYAHSTSLVKKLLQEKIQFENALNTAKLNCGISKEGGILCLSEIPDSLLMWSHYASEHRGIVIEIDANYFFHRQLHRDAGKFIIHRARYRDSRIEDQPIGLYEYLFRTPHDAMATKSTHWNYEHEWRIEADLQSEIFTHLKNSDGNYSIDENGKFIALHEIPETHITKIIFGASCTIANIIKIKNKITNTPTLKHISMKIATVDPMDFRIRLVNMESSDFSDIDEDKYAS